MAGITEISGRNVTGTLTTRRDTIMTNSTIVKEIGMVHIGWHPRNGGVAIIAWLRGNNMRGRFTRCDHIVMTAGTYAKYFIMIHSTIGDRYPRCWSRLMTGIARISGCNM